MSLLRLFRNEVQTVDSQNRPADRVVVSDGITGELQPSGLQNEGRVTEVTVNQTSWTALQRSPTTNPTESPGGPLTDRNTLSVQNTSSFNIKVNAETPSGWLGMLIPPGGERGIDIKDNIIYYCKLDPSAVDATVVVNVEEVS